MYIGVYYMEYTEVYWLSILGVGRGASTKQLIAYLKAQLKNSEPYTRMKLMAVGLQVILINPLQSLIIHCNL